MKLFNIHQDGSKQLRWIRDWNPGAASTSRFPTILRHIQPVKIKMKDCNIKKKIQRNAVIA